jgi:hypothetical protein
MRLYRKLSILFVLLCFVTVAATTAAVAQNTTCAPFVQDAMSAVEKGCARTARNQACYGYVSLSVTPREGATNFNFAKAGDLASVADIDTLRLSALNSVANTWGIALMKLQANLPNTLPGQNVTFLMFGDVTLRNGVNPETSGAGLRVSAKSGANVRGEPSTNGALIGSLAAGDATVANGRTDDSTWLRINIPGSSAQGWVFANLLAATGDLSTLPVVSALEASTEATYRPMQAFYFQSGITQTGCTAAPADGILIQTPKGAGKINLRANDVDIELGSTAFLQAQPSSLMSVSVVEGEGRITANGKTVIVPAGAQTFVPVNSDLSASGRPTDPQPYQQSLVSALPVGALPVTISIAAPANDADIRALNQNVPTPAPSPTPQPTQPSSVSVGSMPGGINPQIFSGLSPALFCQYFMPALQQAGMSKDEYVSQMQQVMGMVPAESQAALEQVLKMVSECP